MEEIAIVRRRSRVVPILLALLVFASIVVAGLYLVGTGAVNIGGMMESEPLMMAGGTTDGLA